MRSVGRGDGMCPVTEAIASTWGMSGSWMTVLVSMGRGKDGVGSGKGVRRTNRLGVQSKGTK